MRLGVKDFDVIASGWAWPGEKGLQQKVEKAFEEGKEVYLNLDPAIRENQTRSNKDWEQIQKLAGKYQLDRKNFPMVRLRKKIKSPSHLIRQVQ